jgi:hypothetical protein
MISEYGKSTVKPRKILRKVLLGLITLLVLLIIGKSIAGSGSLVLFPISRIQIFGTSYVSKREILELMRLDARKSIITFNKAQARRSLLGDVRVSGVEIVKLFPDTLRVYVVEKEKKMLLKVQDRKTGDLGGGGAAAADLFWLSRDGVILAPALEDSASDPTRPGSAHPGPESLGSEGPIITLGANIDDIKVGGRTGDYLLESALEALGGVESRYPGFYRLIETVSIGRDGVRVRLDDERYAIYFGDSVTEEKFEQLRALLLVLQSRQSPGIGAAATGGTAKDGVIEIDMSSSQAAIRRRE